MPTVLEQALRFITNEPRLDNIVNGGDNVDVQLSSGAKIPSLRKLFKNILVAPPANWTAAMQAAGLSKNNKGDPGANVMAISLFAVANTLNIPGGTDLVQTSGYSAPGVGFARYAADAAVDAAYVAAHPKTSFMSNNGRGFKLAEDTVTPEMCGAKCDGVTVDTAAMKAAIATGKTISITYGSSILIDEPLKPQDGQTIYGCGKSAWEPYVGVDGNQNPYPFPPTIKSEIVVNADTAFDCRDSVCVTIYGLSVRATGGAQSRYGFPATFQPGAIGFDITNAYHFELADFSLFGLEAGIHIDPVVERSAQMPRFSDWIASDCKTVFRFGDATSYADATRQYVARDVRIADCPIALHCNEYINIHTTDGLRIENCRFFPGYGKSVYIRDTPYVTLVGLTTFESIDDSITLDNCEGVTAGALQISRTGAYKNGQENFIFCTALTIKDCKGVQISGVIRQPCGKAIQVQGSNSVLINVAVATPFWTKGSLYNGGGAIDVYSSSYVNINATFNEEETYNITVYADADSAETLSGTITGPLFTGTVRGLNLQQQRTLSFRLPAAVEVSPGGAIPFTIKRVKVPPNCLMRSRSVEMTSANFILRGAYEGNAVFWNAVSPEPYGGNLSLQDLPLLDNRGGAAGYKDVSLLIQNASINTLTLPEGHEVHISYGFDLQ